MTAEKLMTTIKKYPALRDNFVNGSWKWIEGKQKDDCANGVVKKNNFKENQSDRCSFQGCGEFTTNFIT